jgi:1,4-dihydroxy-2-naphthoate octaprenyltransferase
MSDTDTRRSGYILQIKFLLFSASIVPALLVGVLNYGTDFSPLSWLLVIVGLFLGQAGGDYLYYYFTNNHTDQRDAHTKIFAGWKPFFAQYFKKENTSLIVGLVVLAANLFILYYFYEAIGWKILAFAAAGGIIALTFTYLMMKGFKELTVFITFGPLSITGGYLAMTGELSMTPLLISIPVGLLITLVAYLKGAKLQISDDGQNVISIKNWLIDSLIFSAYGSLIILVAVKVLPIYSMIGLSGLIPAIMLQRKLSNASASMAEYLSATVQSILIMIITTAGIMAGWILQFHYPITF